MKIFFLFLSRVSFEVHIPNIQKMSYWFKIWMGFVGPILIKLGTSSIWGFIYLPVWCPLGSYLCKYAGDHSVTNEACSLSHLTCLGLCAMAAYKLNGSVCAMRVNLFWSCTLRSKTAALQDGNDDLQFRFDKISLLVRVRMGEVLGWYVFYLIYRNALITIAPVWLRINIKYILMSSDMAVYTETSEQAEL